MPVQTMYVVCQALPGLLPGLGVPLASLFDEQPTYHAKPGDFLGLEVFGFWRHF